MNKNFNPVACVNCTKCNVSPWSVDCLACTRSKQGFAPNTFPNFVKASDTDCCYNWSTQGYTNPLQVFEENGDGCTLDLMSLEKVVKTSGYYVSLTDNEINFITLGFIEKLREQAKYNHNIFLGYWKDEKTMKHYLDLSVWVETLEEAVQMAIDNNQKGIWDIAGADTIYVSTCKNPQCTGDSQGYDTDTEGNEYCINCGAYVEVVK